MINFAELVNSGLNPYEQFLFMLDDLMTSENLTAPLLGRRIGVAPPAVHRWVKEHNRPSRDSFEKLCEAFPIFNMLREGVLPFLVDRVEGEGSRIRELEQENAELRAKLSALQGCTTASPWSADA